MRCVCPQSFFIFFPQNKGISDLSQTFFAKFSYHGTYSYGPWYVLAQAKAFSLNSCFV